MKKYSIKITGKALDDMEAIYDYIASNLQSPDTAIGQYDRIADAIESLDTFPQRCKLFDFEPEHSCGMRQLLVDNYSVVYIVGETEVIVLRVLYSSSDINDRLREG
ncbi:MAG: type II toxin-antitoxin system RelE/ParE family toxin [Clostridiales bacterium]|jgi:plasmid stabilization system protein ParE|nr:type II toxin-antitoxin system RelE/ParE family toxin [Clostridiales bacterium]